MIRALATLRQTFGTLVILLAFAPALAESVDAAQLDRLFPRSTLTIATPDARLHRFNIWVADNDQRRARGLMFVKELADDDGMLFIYPRAVRAGMWMKNTFIPLDMLFVGANGKVVNIVENTEPHSLDTVEAAGDVIAVIELKGGTAARLRIAKGARVLHPAFGRS